MKNVVMSTDDKTLTITVDLTEDFGPSKSGKTHIVASTEGNAPVPNFDGRLSMTVHKQKPKK